MKTQRAADPSVARSFSAMAKLIPEFDCYDVDSVTSKRAI
jgi:hypothetical protein